MQIREAQVNDLPSILEIYNHAVLNTTATYDYEPRSLEHRQKWFDDHCQAGFPVFVAVDPAGRICGWSSLNRYHDRMGYRFTTENSIYVAHDQRGKGVGKLLLAPLITSASALKLHAILAGIDAENAVSIRLHASFGFEPVARFKQVGFKFGRWLDVIYMERLLES